MERKAIVFTKTFKLKFITKRPVKPSIFLAVFFLLILFSNQGLLGQEVSGFPLSKTLIVKKEQGVCQENIRITVEQNQEFTFQVLKDGQPYYQKTESLAKETTTVLPYRLEQGLFNYSFSLRTNDTIIHQSERVLCGESIAIYGQSNGLAIAGVEDYESTYDDQWVRNFKLDTEFWPRGWNEGKDPYATVGVLGLSLAKYFVEQEKTPVSVFNGSVGGKNIDQLMERNNAFPADRSSPYGSFLARVDSSLHTHHFNIFLWVQGEAETTAGEDKMRQYAAKFDTLYQHINKDFPTYDRFIVLQNTLMAEGLGEAGIIRNAQASFMDKYPQITTLATVGQTSSFDGVHYGKEGYERLAWMVYENYKNPSHTSPKLQKIIKDTGSGHLKLVFEEGFKMDLPRSHRLWYDKKYFDSFFYVNGGNNQLTSLRTYKNEIWLGLKDLEKAKYFTYLPSFYSNEYSRHYDGPAIKEKKSGFSALTFYNAEVDEIVKTSPKRELSHLASMIFLPAILEYLKRTHKSKTIKSD